MAQERASVSLFRILRAVAIGVAILLALLWFLFVRGAPERQPTQRAETLRETPALAATPDEPAERDEPSDTPDPPGEEEARPEKPVALVFDGPTRFVRRLQAGDYLLLEEPLADVEHRNELALRVLPHVLRTDGVTPSEADNLYRFLTDPPRNTKAVRLADTGQHDPLGRHKTVRVWTQSGEYPQAELDAGEELLRRLGEVTGKRLAGGVDVLATPKCGAEVFPKQWRYPRRVLGVYFIRDRYCAICTRLAPMLRVEVLKHELAHAYCRRFTRGFIKSRFVSEGLAEYLRYVRPGDYGLRFEAGRMRDNLMALHERFRYLRKMGYPISRLKPQRLVTMSPAQFYSLRGFGYLIAQATLAYLGGEVIERAFRSRSTKILEDKIAEMSWADFLAFVKRGGEGGQAGRVIVIDDPEQIPTPLPKRTLLELGVDGPDFPYRVLHTDPELLFRDPSMLRAVRDAIAAHDGPIAICVDRSDAMDRERRDVVWKYGEWLAGKTVRTVGLGKRVVEFEWEDLDRVVAYDSRNLPRWLQKRRLKRAALVLIVASDSRLNFDVRLLAAHAIEPAAVLVVDLAKEGGSARKLALAFARRQRYRGLVGYERPENK